MASVTCELTSLKYLLDDLRVEHQQRTKLFCDSEAARHIAANLVYHERTKHMEIDCHVVWERIQSGAIVTAHVPSTCQLADLFTKPLGSSSFHSLLSNFGVLDIHTPTWGGVLRERIKNPMIMGMRFDADLIVYKPFFLIDCNWLSIHSFLE